MLLRIPSDSGITSASHFCDIIVVESGHGRDLLRKSIKPWTAGAGESCQVWDRVVYFNWPGHLSSAAQTVSQSLRE